MEHRNNSRKLNLILYFLFFILSPLFSFTQAVPPFKWVKNNQSVYFGTSGSSSYGLSICTDEQANNYTIGWNNGIIYFDACTLNSVGSSNNYIVSFDSSGNLRWGKQIIDGTTNQIPDLVYDHAGHIYTTCSFSGSVSFDGNIYTSNGQLNAHYIARYDTSGNFQWAKVVDPNTPNGWQGNIRLSTDNDHNVYIVGRYFDTLSIDGSIINIPVTDNFYFAKFDSSGTLQLMKSGYASNTQALQITQDLSGGVFIAGNAGDSVSIQSVTLPVSGMFISGFDATGNLKWVNVANGTTVIPAGIQVVNDKLYIGGWYNDSLGIGSTTFYTPTITHNTFLTQFDTAGTFYWAKRMDVITGNQVRLKSMTATQYYIYVAGEYTKSLTFNGIQYTSTTPINSARDPYVAAYDYQGNELWFKSTGSFHEDYGNDIDIDHDHNIYFTGSTHYPGYFDSIVLNDTVATNGGNGNPFGTFIAKIDNHNVLTAPGLTTFSQVQVSPNPFNSQSRITFSNPHNDRFAFTLTDLTGKVIEVIRTNNSEINLTKGNKATGIYLFSLFNEHTSECSNGKIQVSD